MGEATDNRPRRDGFQLPAFALCFPLQRPTDFGHTHIADHSPAEYFPRYAERFSAEELSQMCYWHALPTGWEQMDYREFIEARRPCMAAVIREGFKRLGE